MWIAVVSFALVGAMVGALLARAAARQRAEESMAAARAEAEGLLATAKIEAAAAQRAELASANDDALELRARVDEEITAAVEEIARREERTSATSAELAAEKKQLDAEWSAFRERKTAVQGIREAAKAVDAEVSEIEAQMRARVEERAGTTGPAVCDRLVHRFVEDARAEAANLLRTVEHATADEQVERQARRMLEIVASRYKNHFLTERLISNIPVSTSVVDQLRADDGRLLEAIAEAANVQLHLSDAGDAVRLEGMDGVGREIARRALSQLAKPKHQEEADRDPSAWCERLKSHLDREIRALGKKAFSVLGVKKPEQEIVDLVGKLNYRTSYTQNQWLHAVEASFLAGMIASELGVDVRLARRATLLHDIGKALTHEIDGSHAVIGADIARRSGESDLIANAIAAHHGDEAPTSAYAHIVMAADAMSGARPGARRQLTTEFGHRIEDLERIGASKRGVDRCFAVHGGRELRVYVQEGRFSDEESVALSAEIAEQISEELTFPGQIKVTVIRAYEAVAVAS